MKRRMHLPPWPAFQDQEQDQEQARDGRRCPASPPSAGLPAATVDALDLCQLWRGWEAGTRSELLSRLLRAPQGRSSIGEVAVLEDWICFRDRASELDERARAMLSGRWERLRENAGLRVVIGGLASQAGSMAHDMRLGLRRVLSIRNFLLAAGTDPDRIGIALRGSGWSVTERSVRGGDSAGGGGEWRLQITDPHWTVARN
jgi:outer membrane protein OmpA-like peptidoglycan-associated protein